VGVGRLGQPELEEDLTYVGLDRPRAQEQPLPDRLVGVALGDPAQGVGEDGDVGDALLEQVATRSGCSSSNRIA
jgi:hypothetical protein